MLFRSDTQKWIKRSNVNVLNEKNNGYNVATTTFEKKFLKSEYITLSDGKTIMYSNKEKFVNDHLKFY